MQILKARSSDIPLLLKMMIQFNIEESIEIPVEAMERTVRLSFSHPNHVQTFLAYEGETVVGYIHVCYSFSFEYQGREASIDEIFILNEYRRLGFAKTLIDEIEKEIVANGVVVLRTDISDNRPWLDEFYKGVGFSQVSYRPYYKRV